MDPTTLKAYLDSLCSELDAGKRSLEVVAWAGAALVATGTMTGCFEQDTTPLYGAPYNDTQDLDEELICDDELDDDGDELIDCDDPDCAEDPACMNSGAYAAPPA